MNFKIVGFGNCLEFIELKIFGIIQIANFSLKISYAVVGMLYFVPGKFFIQYWI